MRRTLTTFAVLPVLLLGVAACSEDATRDDSGEVTEESDVAATKVREGDCIESAELGEVQSLKAIPCSEPHGAEAYHAFDLPADFDTEGQDAIGVAAQTGCTEAFEEFVGLAYDESALEISQLTPTPESFETGDRAVVCFVVDPDTTTTGSLEGAAR